MKTISEELQQVSKKNGGILRAEDVLEFAKNPKTTLHSHFDWEDTDAARKWRLHQARNIIRVNVTVLPQVEKNFRTFVSLNEDRQKEGGGYRPTVAVLSDVYHRASLIQQALDDLRRWQKRYKMLKEFAGVFEAIDNLQPPPKRKRA